MMIEEFKKDINNSLKEIQENTGKQVEALKGETQKYELLSENITVREKTIFDDYMMGGISFLVQSIWSSVGFFYVCWHSFLSLV